MSYMLVADDVNSKMKIKVVVLYNDSDDDDVDDFVLLMMTVVVVHKNLIHK